MTETPYTLVFYKDENGDEPALRWLREELGSTQKRAIGVAMHEILCHEGVDVCQGEFGKALGDGLYEFRLRYDSAEILARKGRVRRVTDRLRGKSERILLRVFFHPHGDKLILLLGGFDKSRFPGKRHQDRAIATARQRLERWKQSSRS